MTTTTEVTTTYDVIKLPSYQPKSTSIVVAESVDDYAKALALVAGQRFSDPTRELVPISHTSCSALTKVNALQGWELRQDGVKVALVAIVKSEVVSE